MADKAKLAETLQKLDAGNENHWTSDGSPRLETLKFLSGGESYSRDDVSEHFGDFNKASAKDYDWTGVTGDINPGQDAEGKDTGVHLDTLPKVDGTDDREGTVNTDPKLGAANPDAPDQRPGQDAEGNLTGVQAPAVAEKPPELFNPSTSEPARAPGTSGLHAAGELTESPREDGAGAAAQASQPGEGDGAEGAAAREAEQSSVDQRLADTDEVEDLEEELEEVEEALSDLRRSRDDLNKDIDEGNRHADKLRGRIAQLKGSDQTNTIQSYLESRKEAMALRGENRATLKAAGLTLKGITQAVAPAPIDSAMARKNTRGSKRPTRV
jgi:hypothetical protein